MNFPLIEPRACSPMSFVFVAAKSRPVVLIAGRLAEPFDVRVPRGVDRPSTAC
jgi:hypothetical protein